jgi:hypothetical protein
MKIQGTYGRWVLLLGCGLLWLQVPPLGAQQTPGAMDGLEMHDQQLAAERNALQAMINDGNTTEERRAVIQRLLDGNARGLSIAEVNRLHVQPLPVAASTPPPEVNNLVNAEPLPVAIARPARDKLIGNPIGAVIPPKPLVVDVAPAVVKADAKTEPAPVRRPAPKISYRELPIAPAPVPPPVVAESPGKVEVGKLPAGSRANSGWEVVCPIHGTFSGRGMVTGCPKCEKIARQPGPEGAH